MFPAVVEMVDRAVRIDWVLLAASGMAPGPDAKSGGSRDAGWNGVACCVLPILSLVVLSRLACVHRSAFRLLSDGGKARDMIEKDLSASITIDRLHAQVLEEPGLVLRHNLDLARPETFRRYFRR